MPQVCIATAQVILHKFYARRLERNSTHSRYNEFFIAMACLYIGMKAEDCLRKISDVLVVFDRIYKRANNLPLSLFTSEMKRYEIWRQRLLDIEMAALDELGYILKYEHPHKMLLSYLHTLELDSEVFSQRAWNYLNDSCRSPLYVDFNPEALTCSVIYLTAIELNEPMISQPVPWYKYFDVDFDEIIRCCSAILILYTYPVAKYTPEQDKDEKSLFGADSPSETVELTPASKSINKSQNISSRSETDVRDADSKKSKHNPSVSSNPSPSFATGKIQDYETIGRMELSSARNQRNVKKAISPNKGINGYISDLSSPDDGNIRSSHPIISSPSLHSHRKFRNQRHINERDKENRIRTRSPLLNKFSSGSSDRGYEYDLSDSLDSVGSPFRRNKVRYNDGRRTPRLDNRNLSGRRTNDQNGDKISSSRRIGRSK